ncbi:unnamed protein product [Meloidogyne enterolobii]|uniref:Uncharacterized protein n=1 Tax=Meloidogyne enterolobii TaxID=390850 RepID=A0ACB0YV85_MELEN
MDAREVEIMLQRVSGTTSMPQAYPQLNAMQQLQSSYMIQPGKFQSLNHTNPNREQPRNGWRYNSNGYSRNQNNFKNFQRNDRRGQSFGTPFNERRWNNRPICNYCQKVEHFASTCRTRMAEYMDKQKGNANMTQSSSNQRY